ncbi:hypothetical protein LTR04_004906 [Oleoguttula sp. CCFEE 6159]|nr:hypothetical protein LTR04_004906 [Oleoguttula sp. CCFEE 6159]
MAVMEITAIMGVMGIMAVMGIMGVMGVVAVIEIMAVRGVMRVVGVRTSLTDANPRRADALHDPDALQQPSTVDLKVPW